MSATEWVKAAFDQYLPASAAASVLVVMVLIIQWLLRKSLSAAYRYGLWLPVLVRLLLPVVPESPFSLFNVPRWFEGTHKEAAAVVPRTVVPRPAGQVLERVIDFPQPHLVSPAPQTKGWSRADFWTGVLWVWCSGVVVLLVRLAVGSLWLRFRLKGGSHAATAELRQIMEQAGKDTGVRAPRILMTGMVESPALFGVFRPKLLLPAGFEGKLDARGVRHVFLHELAHIKRGDLPVNFFMTVAQAVHWMNPLVWLACRRMRLERELACDEMALSFSHGAEAREYGATILRLLTGLEQRRRFPALVGIAEEKYAAKRRIEGIAAFQPRKQSGWGVALVLTALALVGLTKAQTTGPGQVLTDPEWEQRFQTAAVEGFELGEQTLPEALESLRKKLPKELQDAVFCLQEYFPMSSGQGFSADAVGYISMPMTNIDSSAHSVEVGPLKVRKARASEVVDKIMATAEGSYLVSIKGRRVTVFDSSRFSSSSIAWWKKNSEEAALRPTATQGRRLIEQRLESIIIPEFSVERGVRLPEALARLMRKAKANDPEKLGVNLTIVSGSGQNAPGAMASSKAEDFTVLITAKNKKLRDVLGMILETATPPVDSGSTNLLTYAIEDDGVVIANASKVAEALFTRTFKLDPKVLAQGLEIMTHNPGPGFWPGQGANEFYVGNLMSVFLGAGVDFKDGWRVGANGEPPQQKSVFFNDRTGILFVRATLRDLDVVENVLQRLNSVPSQIRLELKGLQLDSGEPEGRIRQSIAAVTGDSRLVLTEAEFGKIWQDVGEMEGVSKIDPQRLITVSGRSERVKVSGSQFEVMADAGSGLLIKLRAATYLKGQEGVRRRMDGVLYDGQTMVVQPRGDRGSEAKGPSVILFVTAVVLDPAGNPIPATGSQPYDREKTPPQLGE